VLPILAVTALGANAAPRMESVKSLRSVKLMRTVWKGAVVWMDSAARPVEVTQTALRESGA